MKKPIVIWRSKKKSTRSTSLLKKNSRLFLKEMIQWPVRDLCNEILILIEEGELNIEEIVQPYGNSEHSDEELLSDISLSPFL